MNNTDINIETNKKIDSAEHGTIAQCPACGLLGDPKMHVEPTRNNTVCCSRCGEQGTLSMDHKVYYCHTCKEDREGDGQCEECDEELEGDYRSAVTPEEYTCFKCSASFQELAIEGVNYQCPM